MVFNQIKNSVNFTFLKDIYCKTILLCLSVVISLSVNAATEEASNFNNELVDISYNTISNEQIVLVFSFASAINNLPEVKTSMSPAYVQISFEANAFNNDFKKVLINHAGVKTVNLDASSGNVVALVSLAKLAVFDVSLENDKEFSITFNSGESANIVETLSPAGESFINNIEAIDFKLNSNNEGQVLVYLSDNMLAADVNDNLGKLNIELHNTEIIDDLLYKLDVTDFGSLVTNIETFRDGRNARLVVDTNSDFIFTQEQKGNLFILTVKEKPTKAPSYLGETDEFNGRNISLSFQDIPVRTVLQIIADYNEFNLIISDTVTGNITLQLDGVPWDQALSIILKVKGLDKRMQGNILMVAPSDELAAREAQTLQAKQQVEELAPLYSEYVQINYAKAAEFAELIKNNDTSILSARGSVSVDERTNTLLVRDTAKSIEDIIRMISVLDISVRQVVIEARMVTVKDDMNEELGIRWGATNTDGESTVSGSMEGVDTARGGSVPSITDRLNVNLPVVSPAGTIAFQVARLANGTILDLELSALEKENKGEVIASPRITTANQKEAYIEQGVQIPYQEAASSGATATQFKKAVLSLKVTPHITPDDKVILDLEVTQDTVSTISSGTAPAIDTQRLATQVLVNNGETIVLGGIYQQSIVSTISKVPFLGDIPYLGLLFRTSSQLNEKKELLIFVTPRIVTESF